MSRLTAPARQSVLLFGSGDEDPLFLQVKEAVPAAHAPYLPPLPPYLQHDGRRVVAAQRTLQASIDVLLGTTTIDGRPFYVRQMKNMKASMPIEWLVGEPFNEYALGCGAILARAHARTNDAAMIASYGSIESGGCKFKPCRARQFQGPDPVALRGERQPQA